MTETSPNRHGVEFFKFGHYPTTIRGSGWIWWIRIDNIESQPEMSAGVPVSSSKQYRLARYYLDKLRSARHIYQQGDENASHGLKLVQQDWAQIQQWQAWAAAQAAQQEETAQLCSAYSLEGCDLLDLMLTPQEQRVWRDAALTAARQKQDQRAEMAHLLALSIVYDRLGQDRSANECALQALVLAEQFNDLKCIGRACLMLGDLVRRQGNYVAARNYLERSLKCFRPLKNHRDLASTLHSLARIAFVENDLTVCRECLDESLHLYQQLGDERGVATILYALRIYSFDEPTRLSTRINAEERLRIYQQTGDRLGSAEMLQILAGNAFYTRDFAASEHYLREHLRLNRQLEMPRQIASDLLSLGVLSLLQARYSQGQNELLECLTFCRQYNLLAVAAHVLILLAFAYWGQGDVENMRAVLRKGLPSAHELAAEIVPLGIAAVAALHLLTRRPEDASQLIGMVDAYPGTASDTRMFAVGVLLQVLEGILDAETLATALKRGRLLDYDLTVAAIIAEIKG